ncbi:MAG: histidinol phosphatase [Cytophagaceae bacterium SCN 52-12]|nr:MAG: histidinol phosphatase [Cytophagaceae bacterium SCN 52-12]
MFNKIFSWGQKRAENQERVTFDLHSHLIPGIDDGARTMADSVEMIRQMAAQGFTHLVTTPHIMWDSYKNTPEIIRKGLGEVREACLENGIDIRLDAAAEYFIDEHFLELLRGRGELLTLPGNRLLVELPYTTPLMNTTETLFSIIGYGYRPVLAHPERYSYFHAGPEVYHRLKEQGCELQLNALSLTGQYGSGVQKVARWLLKQQLVTFIGSDAHDIRHVKALAKAMELRVLRDYDFFNNEICPA